MSVTTSAGATSTGPVAGEEEEVLESADLPLAKKSCLGPPENIILINKSDDSSTSSINVSGGGGTESNELVSIIMPVYNAEVFLEEALISVLAQTYRPLELVCFDDSSSDSSWKILERFATIFLANSILLTMARSPREHPSGPGFARNQAVQNSSGVYLCHLDADDVMYPERVALQRELALQKGDRCLVGSNFDRIPADSTSYYTTWLNSLSDDEVTAQQFRECTIICPSWFMHRNVFNAVEAARRGGGGGGDKKCPERGAYVEADRDPKSGKLVRVPEDTFFFMDHMELGGSLAKVPKMLVSYRYSAGSWCTGTSHSDLFLARMPYIERRIIMSPAWQSGFTIWGYGKDGKKFAHLLGKEAASRVVAFCDVDPNKIGIKYFITSCKKHVPVVHFLDAKPPIIVCVASKRAGATSIDGNSLEDNIKRLNLKEGVDYFHFC